MRPLFRYLAPRNLIYLILEGLLVLLFLGFELRAHPKGYFSIGQLLAIPLICQLCFYFSNAYAIDFALSLRALLIRNIEAVAAAFAVFLLVFTLLPQFVVRDLFPSLFLLLLVLIGSRIVFRKAIEGGRMDENVLLIGSGRLADQIQEEVTGSRWSGYKIARCLDETDPTIRKGLDSWIREHSVQKIVVAISERRGQFPIESLVPYKMEGKEILDGVAFYERLTGKILIEPLKPAWLVFNEGFRRPLLARVGKCFLDYFLACVGLFLAFPIFVVIPLLIKLDSAGPVFLRQKRVGAGGKEFWLLKFRSMRADAEAHGRAVWASEKDSRVTRVGAVIRRLRIDEIPQMINVIKGEMSFVGPRPERPMFVEMLRERIPFYDLRLFVKPGITGWAQVRYRYGATEEDALEKLQYDLYYIKHLSVLFDLLIVFQTLQVVLTGKGAR